MRTVMWLIGTAVIIVIAIYIVISYISGIIK